MIYILADIHANLSALQSVFCDMDSHGYNPKTDRLILLGDFVDYGMRPNEVIDFLSNHIENAIIVEGNHENALLSGKSDRFSSEKGRRCLEYTRSILTKKSLAFLEKLKGKSKKEIQAGAKKVLIIHGSLADCYWGQIDAETQPEEYSAFDVVLSAHSHKRHLFTKYISIDNKSMRNKKAILFCNPGSVGQPRNHIAKAQYCFCDDSFENFTFRAVSYDIEEEQGQWTDEIDVFYKDRLLLGV